MAFQLLSLSSRSYLFLSLILSPQESFHRYSLPSECLSLTFLASFSTGEPCASSSHHRWIWWRISTGDVFKYHLPLSQFWWRLHCSSSENLLTGLPPKVIKYYLTILPWMMITKYQEDHHQIPRWCPSGRLEEAAASLQWSRGPNFDIQPELEEILKRRWKTLLLWLIAQNS